MSTINVPMREMITRTAHEANVLRRETDISFKEARLSDYIGMLLNPSSVNSREKERQRALFADINETCRRRSGQVANGTWIPFDAHTRDLTTSSAGSLVVETVGRDVAPSLLPTSAVISSGATVLTNLVGSHYNVTSVSGLTPQGAAYWVAEGDDGEAIDPTINVVKMTPGLIVVETVVSRTLLNSTHVDVDQLIRHEIARHIGIAIDDAALMGDGVDKPLGLLKYPDLDVIAAGTDGAVPAYQHLVDIEHQVRSRAHLLNPSFTLSPDLVKRLRTTARNGTGSAFVMEGDTLLGYPVHVTPLMPSDLTKGTGTGLAALLFGDLSELVIGFWGPAAVDFLVHPSSTSGDVKITARVDVGVVPRHLDAFTAYMDLKV